MNQIIFNLENTMLHRTTLKMTTVAFSPGARMTNALYEPFLTALAMAGMPTAVAAVGLSKPERQKKGKSGGIIGFFFARALIVAEGLSCAGLQGGNMPPWILLDGV